ncbi:MAG: tRNA 2-thiouridine(34) synthase MnmA [Candidatus Aminicenantes bacterium]
MKLKGMKIAVGMSGGVDSSVAAWLLKRDGHDVTGMTMKLWAGGPGGPVRKSACFGPDEAGDIEAARKVCAHIGIPYSVIDCAAGYEDLVLRYFREEYLSGKTPNPCVRCNQLVKFGMLPRLAKEAGLAFDRFATGHYARVEPDARTGRFLLKRAVDSRKDQSYFLYRLSQEQLASTLFPLGGFTKVQVRRMAAEAGLPVVDRKESQDFYGGDPADLIGLEDREGDIVDRQGRVLGKHRGYWNYTIGQRKGLGIAHPVPLYVLGIDAARNRLVVGPEAETFKRSCVASDCNWSAFDILEAEMSAQVKVRSAGKLVAAVISPVEGGRTMVRFAEPVSAVTPGQSVVFYDGDVLVGGGVIESAD